MSIFENSKRPEAMAADPRFLKGLHLFNEKEYFECHEVIEALWLVTPSEDGYRDLYKGVIQAAASLYQFDRGVLSGANGLCKSALGYLAKYKPRALGLNVARLIEEMDAFYQNPAKQARPVLEFEEQETE